MNEDGEFTYDPELEPGYFIQIRSDFVRSGAFTSDAKILYEVLLTFAAERVKAWPGQARLCECCQVTANTLRKALRELQQTDPPLVTIKRRGQGLTNMYHLHKLAILPANRVRDTQNLRIRTRNPSVSRHATVAHKVQSDQLDSVNTDEPTTLNGRNLARERTALAGVLRYTKQDVAAGLAAWDAAGQPPYNDWLQGR